MGGAVITGLHTIVYAEDAERARAFLRDVLGLAFVDAHAKTWWPSRKTVITTGRCQVEPEER